MARPNPDPTPTGRYAIPAPITSRGGNPSSNRTPFDKPTFTGGNRRNYAPRPVLERSPLVDEPAATDEPTPDPVDAVDEQQRSSARAIIANALRDYGLDTPQMLEWAWNQIALDRSPDEVIVDLRQRPEYAARFPGMQRRRDEGLNPISERDYINFENGVRQWHAQNGLPDGFLDTPEMIANLIGWDWSLPELETVGNLGWARVAKADAAVHQAFADIYGTDGPLAFFMMQLNEERSIPILEQQVEAGFIAGAAKRQGWNISAERAKAYAAAGITDPQARAGFAELDQDRQLYIETASEDIDFRAEVEGADSVFGVAPGDMLKRRRDERVAAGRGGGAAVIGRKGTGLGTADK